MHLLYSGAAQRHPIRNTPTGCTLARPQTRASNQSHSCPLVSAEVSQRPRVELLALFSFLYDDPADLAQIVLVFIPLPFSTSQTLSIALASSSNFGRTF